jgi:aromatic ring-opening dioxygenase catalytic subunit (LigB family)
VADIRRLLEVAVFDTLGLENSIARSRTLAYLAMTAIKLLDAGEFEHRLEALEGAVKTQNDNSSSVFDAEPTENLFSVEAES